MHLKEWKEANGYSYAALGAALYLSRSFAYKLCAGLHWPDKDVHRKIMKLTGNSVTPNDILAGLKK